MTTYDERRIVSYVARLVCKGMTLEQAVIRASKRRPPFAESEVRAAWPDACQAVRNAELIQAHFDAIAACYNADGECVRPDEAERLRNVRVCDIRGCRWPSQTNIPQTAGV